MPFPTVYVERAAISSKTDIARFGHKYAVIYRTLQHREISALASAPDALTWMSNGEPLDWQSILTATDSNMLVRDSETGSFALFQFKAPALWEGHIINPPTVRGTKAVQSARRMLQWFDNHIGASIFAKCHVGNRRVFHFMPHIGFRYAEVRDGQAYFQRQ